MFTKLGLSIGLAAISSTSHAALQPYTADAYTAVLYHFDEAPGAADPGNAIVNYGYGGAALNLTNTGGPDGRDNLTANGGGYAAAAYSGFGTAFNVFASGTGTYHTDTNASGGGALTAGGVAQSSLHDATGAFTYEAIIRTSGTTAEQQILSHDGSTARGFLFRVLNGNLAFYNGASDLTAPIPTTGNHAFVANRWFHVAVSYSGAAGAAGNIRFYWTALDSSAVAANTIGSATLGADLGNNTNTFGIGTTTRNPFRREIEFLDEVRLSTIVRDADDFIFVPEPGAIALLGGAGAASLLRRSRPGRKATRR